VKKREYKRMCNSGNANELRNGCKVLIGKELQKYALKKYFEKYYIN